MKRCVTILVLVLAVVLVIAVPPGSADVRPAVPPVPQNVQASDGTHVNFVRVTWMPSPGTTYL